MMVSVDILFIVYTCTLRVATLVQTGDREVYFGV